MCKKKKKGEVELPFCVLSLWKKQQQPKTANTNKNAMVHKGVYIKVFCKTFLWWKNMSSNCPVCGFVQKIDSKTSVLCYCMYNDF